MSDHTGADGEGQVDRVCHDEQMTIWTGEIAGSLSMGGYLREDLSYDDNLDVHAVIAKNLRSIIGSAMTHPEISAAEVPSEIPTLKAEIERLKGQRNTALTEKNALYAALAESERKRVEAEAEIAATRARLPETLQEGKLEFGVANLAMAYRGANDRWWRYGYATRMLLDFAERSAGEGYCFTAEEGRPAIDAADLCYTVAKLVGCELGDSTYESLIKPVTERELAPYLATTPTQETTHVEG